jgi:hypothetical protein
MRLGLRLRLGLWLGLRLRLRLGMRLGLRLGLWLGMRLRLRLGARLLLSSLACRSQPFACSTVCVISGGPRDRSAFHPDLGGGRILHAV